MIEIRNRKKENNYAFIDSQNLNLSIRDCGWSLDFLKFYTFIKHKYRITKSFLFIGYLKENEGLYKYLKKIGYVLVFKPVLGKGDFIKGNVDAELVLHTMLQYKNFDKAIIISGDGDFYCLVEQLLKDEKLLKIGIPNKNKYSALLRNRSFREYHFYVNHFRKRFEYKKKAFRVGTHRYP